VKIRPAFVFLYLLLLSASSAWAKSDHSYRMDVPLTSERTVNFDVQEGEFILRGDPSATAVRMEVSIDRFFIFRLGEQDILKKLIKVTHDNGDSVTIATDIPKSIANWGRAEYPIDFTVIVPANMNIRVHDTSGLVDLSDLAGNVTIDDGSGTLTASRLSGNLRITKESGDIRIEQVRGETKINSRSGQMHLADLGRLEIDNSEGNLTVANIDSGDIHNGSGNVHVTGAKSALKLVDTSGEIVVRQIGGAVDIQDTSGQIRVSDAGAVTIRDTDGNVTVENAHSLKVTDKESGEVMVRNVTGPVDVPSSVKLKRRG